MADDDIIRSMLEREARLVPTTQHAPDALASLGPAFRRSAVKRASMIAASTALVLGGTAAAFNVVRPTEDEISVISSVTPTTEPRASTTTIGTVATSLDGRDEPSSTTIDDHATPSPIELSDDGDPVAPSTAPATSPSPEPTPSTTTRSGDEPAPPPPPQPPDTTAPPVTTAAPGATSVPTTSPLTGQPPTRFDSSCGYVTADLTTSPPTIVEIVPAAGYRSRVEDPDGNSITVQFTGVGEDCEITIGDHDGADHAERSEPDESSVD